MMDILFKATLKSSPDLWVTGYYVKHITRTICPIGDRVRPRDIYHCIMRDGFSDWNMPRDTEHFEINPETLCQYVGASIREKYVTCPKNTFTTPVFTDDIIAIYSVTARKIGGSSRTLCAKVRIQYDPSLGHAIPVCIEGDFSKIAEACSTNIWSPSVPAVVWLKAMGVLANNAWEMEIVGNFHDKKIETEK